MSLGNLIYQLNAEEKKIIRKIEKTLYKLNAVETALIFNATALREGLLPNYTRLRLHDPAATRDDNTTSFRRTLVLRQQEEKKKEKKEIKMELDALRIQRQAASQGTSMLPFKTCSRRITAKEKRLYSRNL